jgi:S1-C subfamily serine protease
MCGRRVPKHVETCRCGFRVSEAVIGSHSGASDSAGSRSVLPFVIGLVAIAAAGAAIWYFSMRPRVHPASASAEAPAPATATPARTAASSPGSASRATPSPAAARPAEEPGRPTPPSENAPARAADPTLEDVIGRASPAVVSIETTDTRGSGFFVASDRILTNSHVVEGHAYVTVKLTSGQSLTARVATTSADYDLALLRVDRAPAGQSVLQFSMARDVRVGQEVVAIGSAMGVLQNTVTRGIISALRRAGPVLLLQTDAAINPGNSGGPLLDRQGRVVGITTMKLLGQSESIGFAVASDHALSLIQTGRPAPAAGAEAGGPGGAMAAPSGLTPARPSASDDARENGAIEFDRAMQAAERRADEVDQYWARFRTDCSPKLPAANGDREWFGIWDERAQIVSPGGDCGAWLAELRRAASAFRNGMVTADEAARRVQVYPGVRREVRRKYRLDWTGWER